MFMWAGIVHHKFETALHIAHIWNNIQSVFFSYEHLDFYFTQMHSHIRTVVCQYVLMCVCVFLDE